MKAVIYTEYGSPDVLELKEIEQPIPGDDEVLVRIHAAAATAADCAARKGEPLLSRLFFGLRRPKKQILGTELAGEIVATGSNVEQFNEGDQIVASTGDSFGAHAEYICLPKSGAMAAKPDNLSYGESTAICEGALTALPFLRDKGAIQSGQNVLINGASGSVGTAAVQIAKHFGANVTGVCSTANVELVKSLGADRVIDYTREDFTSNGEAYDIIFDAVGKSSFSRCKKSLKKGGYYLSTVLSPTILMQTLWTSLVGSRKAIITFTGLRSSQEKISDLLLLKELAEAGKMRPVIGRKFPLEKTADAHRYVETGHKQGNAVITMESA